MLAAFCWACFLHQSCPVAGPVVNIAQHACTGPSASINIALSVPLSCSCLQVWYGVPAAAAAALDAAMRDALPHLFDKDHLLLHKLITMLSPAQLAARGVPVCRAVQVPGSFVVTFPDAYHAGFNSGFNVAEAVNFAAPDWLPFGSSSVVRYR